MWQDLRIPHTGLTFILGWPALRREYRALEWGPEIAQLFTSSPLIYTTPFFLIIVIIPSQIIGQVHCLWEALMYYGSWGQNITCVHVVFIPAKAKKNIIFFLFTLLHVKLSPQLKAPLMETHVKAATVGTKLPASFSCVQFKHTRYSYLKDRRTETHARPTQAMCVWTMNAVIIWNK